MVTNYSWEMLLQQLPQPNEEDALFEIYEDGGYLEGGFIRANKEGMQLVARELLLCLSRFEEQGAVQEPSQQPLGYPEVFAGGWVIPDHLELLPFKRTDRPAAPVPATAGDDSATLSGLLLLLAFLLLSMTVGVVTMIRWLFSWGS